MQIWTTDDIPAAERFAYWREVRAKNIYGVTAELDRSQHADFRGTFSTTHVGGAVIGEMHASSYSVTRGEPDIADAPRDSLCLYQQLDGGGGFATRNGHDFVVAAGELAISHSDLPYRTTPLTDAGFHLRLVQIPFACCSDILRETGNLIAAPLQLAPGPSALLQSYMHSFVARAPHLQRKGGPAASRTLALLALASRGLVSLKTEPVREAMQTARLDRVLRFIEYNLHQSDLGPIQTAAALAISVRQLHLLFEQNGMSFSRTVTAMRLALARHLLTVDIARPVAEIAFACGFDSLATFYRVFRHAFEMTPSDMRARRVVH
jgi:AraC-like DNA-binding protein